jgi:hypothetical protein
MKHLKTLGLAAMAALALAASVGVSSASAVTEFHATGGTALTGVVGENNHVFTIEGSAVTCNTIAFNGTAAAGGTSVNQTMHPTYSNCTAFGIINAVINTHDCNYLFNANTFTVNLQNCNNTNSNAAGPINIVALSGIGNCRAEVSDRSLNGVLINQAINNQMFTNMGNTGSNTATLTENSAANNIIANVTESNGICPINVGVKNNAEYDGNTGIMGATGGTSF